MSQQVQELISKIKTEGLQAADQKAREIEAEATKKAAEIMENTQRRSRQMMAEAEAVIKKREESARMALQQAGRDMLLSLRKEIEKTLRGIVTAKVGEAMTPERLSHIIREVSQKAVDQNTVDKGIEVVLNAQDFKGLGNGFLAELQKQLKKPLELKSSDDMGKGFMISFDKGKSCFDFSDASLADYLSASLNEQVAALLKEAV